VQRQRIVARRRPDDPFRTALAVRSLATIGWREITWPLSAPRRCSCMVDLMSLDPRHGDLESPEPAEGSNKRHTYHYQQRPVTDLRAMKHVRGLFFRQGRILGFSNWGGSVRRQRSDCQLVGRSEVSMPATSRLRRESTDRLGSDSRVVTLHRSTRHTNVARAPRV
jgi:hypothetical protein